MLIYTEQALEDVKYPTNLASSISSAVKHFYVNGWTTLGYPNPNTDHRQGMP